MEVTELFVRRISKLDRVEVVENDLGHKFIKIARQIGCGKFDLRVLYEPKRKSGYKDTDHHRDTVALLSFQNNMDNVKFARQKIEVEGENNTVRTLDIRINRINNKPIPRWPGNVVNGYV